MSWEERSIDEISEIVTKGTTPSTYGYDFIKEGVNYIRAEGISKDGMVDETTFLKISPDCHQKLKRSQLKTDDILFSIAGMALGKTGIVKDSFLPANTNQAVAIVRPIKELIISKFLQYQFINPNFYELVNKFSAQSAQPNINLTQLKSLSILTPPIKTQKRIADILSAYDDLIENNLKRIKLLEQVAQNIYKEWFVNMRFPGHENTPVDQETGFPEGWEQKELGELISKLESGSRPKGGIDKTLKVGVPSIGAESIRGLGYFDFSKTKYVNRDFFLKMKKGRLKHKDILIYKDGAYIGRSTLFQDSFPFEECSVNEHVFLIHSSNELLQYYLYFTLHSNVYYEKMQNLNSNAAQPGINQTKIKTLLILVPVDDLLIEFDKLISPIVKQIYVLAKENLKLKNARDILLPRLMNQTIEV
jgi:type I restriction enzyme, S subunit